MLWAVMRWYSMFERKVNPFPKRLKSLSTREPRKSATHTHTSRNTYDAFGSKSSQNYSKMIHWSIKLEMDAKGIYLKVNKLFHGRGRGRGRQKSHWTWVILQCAWKEYSTLYGLDWSTQHCCSKCIQGAAVGCWWWFFFNCPQLYKSVRHLQNAVEWTEFILLSCLPACLLAFITPYRTVSYRLCVCVCDVHLLMQFSYERHLIFDVDNLFILCLQCVTPRNQFNGHWSVGKRNDGEKVGMKNNLPSS